MRIECRSFRFRKSIRYPGDSVAIRWMFVSTTFFDFAPREEAETKEMRALPCYPARDWWKATTKRHPIVCKWAKKPRGVYGRSYKYFHGSFYWPLIKAPSRRKMDRQNRPKRNFAKIPNKKWQHCDDTEGASNANELSADQSAAGKGVDQWKKKLFTSSVTFFFCFFL